MKIKNRNYGESYCLICRTKIKLNSSTHKFCKKCWKIENRKFLEKNREKYWENRLKKFGGIEGYRKYAKNVAKKCRDKKRLERGIRCKYCGKSLIKPYSRLYCSECYNGIYKKEYNKKYHLNKRYDGNALKIYERDNFKCVSCNSKDNLIIHHIDGNKKNNMVSNLIILCRECHSSLEICCNVFLKRIINSVKLKELFFEKLIALQMII